MIVCFCSCTLHKYLIYNKTLHCIIAHRSSKNQFYIHFNALCPLFMSSLMESSRIVKTTDWWWRLCAFPVSVQNIYWNQPFLSNRHDITLFSTKCVDTALLNKNNEISALFTPPSNEPPFIAHIQETVSNVVYDLRKCPYMYMNSPMTVPAHRGNQ